MGFRETFLQTPAGPQREALVYREAIKRGPPRTVPITVPGPSGTKITYKVMPDFLMIDGIRVPMSAVTAQRVAAHFGMSLPTSKMVKQISEAAKQSGGAMTAKPLSATGLEFEGKHYSAQDVVQDVSRPEFAVGYSERVNQDPTFQNAKENAIFDGWYKTIMQPESSQYANMLHFMGINAPDGSFIQRGRSPHSAKNYSEYAAAARFVDDNVTVETPDGKVINTTLGRILRLPNMSKAISDSKGMKYYRTSKTRKPGPPPGYTSAFKGQTPPPEAQAIATQILNSNKPLWSLIPITVGGKNYIAKIEPHSNAARGISIYQKKKGPTITPPKVKPEEKPIDKPKSKPTTTTVEQRKGIWDRVNNFLNKLNIF